MRGATRERLDALVAAVSDLPAHLPEIMRKYRAGNAELSHWITAVRAQGRQVALVVMIERFGDIVACLPIAQHLRKSRPELAVAWICAERFASLPSASPAVDAVFTEESIATWLMTKKHLPADLECHELFLDTQRCTWTGLRPPKARSGITHANYLRDGSDLLTAYSRAAGLQGVADVQPELRLPRLEPSWEGRLALGPLMAVHFDSEDPDRRLSEDSARVFVAKALKLGWTVVELGLRPVVSANDPRVLFPGRGLPLIQQVALLNTATYFAGTLSGFMVCANALSKPATVFIGTFRGFTTVRPASGTFWIEQWDCIYGPWPACQCPVGVAVDHVPIPENHMKGPGSVILRTPDLLC
ncbi:MAG: hypothetical protein IPL72_10995 [Sulfuritalea sp.]|nr:hypothetical protein [Sulfuritalea sp.]